MTRLPVSKPMFNALPMLQLSSVLSLIRLFQKLSSFGGSTCLVLEWWGINTLLVLGWRVYNTFNFDLGARALEEHACPEGGGGQADAILTAHHILCQSSELYIQIGSGMLSMKDYETKLEGGAKFILNCLPTQTSNGLRP